MKKAYKIRLYPTDNQKILIHKSFGCARKIYNDALKEFEYYRENLKELNMKIVYAKINDFQKNIPNLKKEFDYLKEPNSVNLIYALQNLKTAFQRYKKGLGGFPNFKSKYKKDSFQSHLGNKIDFDKRKIYLIKFSEGIKFRCGYNKIEGTLKTVTVSKRADKYFASLCVDTTDELPAKSEIDPKKTLGIDVGLSDFCTLSTGQKISNPKFAYSDLDKRKRILQKRLAKKQKHSRRYNILKNQIAKIDYKISCKRKDNLHKLSYELTNGNGYTTIAVENLNIQGMMKNKHLSRSIADASWYSFYEMLRYKCDWNGKNFIKIGRFDPSSKKCSYCGYENKELKLSQRSWICPECDTLHDRDVNAALNIKEFASSKTPEVIRGEHVEPFSIEKAMKRES